MPRITAGDVILQAVVEVTIRATPESSLAISGVVESCHLGSVIAIISHFVCFRLFGFLTEVKPQACAKAARSALCRFRPSTTYLIPGRWSLVGRLRTRWRRRFVRIDPQFRSQVSPSRIERRCIRRLSINFVSILPICGLEAGNHLGGNSSLKSLENAGTVWLRSVFWLGILASSVLRFNARFRVNGILDSRFRRRLGFYFFFFCFGGRFSGAGCSEQIGKEIPVVGSHELGSFRQECWSLRCCGHRDDVAARVAQAQ